MRFAEDRPEKSNNCPSYRGSLWFDTGLYAIICALTNLRSNQVVVNDQHQPSAINPWQQNPAR